MNDARLKISQADIEKHFNSLPQKIFRISDIADILTNNRDAWRLSASIATEAFAEYLADHSSLKRIEFAFTSRKEIRYTWGDVPMYELLLSLKPGAYFSHYTAVYFHELSEQIPRTIYLNVEQKAPGNRSGSLEQQAIDTAFKRKVRVSNEAAVYQDYRVCIVHGMGQGQLGVEERQGSQGETIRVTDLERTLIDITVRPVYSGGVSEVLKAYREAQGRVSINRLTAYLKKTGYIYPYHQAIGFYLERAGNYKPAQIELLRQFERKYDFYLVHEMGETEYSKEWRLYFPKGF
jgi:predicted transcriptional regulator of viral defense system